jgi:hypothetical protein
MYGMPRSRSRPSAALVLACRRHSFPTRRSSDLGLGHLHERQDALLHARPAARRQDHGGQLLGRRPLEQPGDLLADHRAHRAAHELELKDPERHPQLVQAADEAAEGVGGPERLFQAAQAVGVALGVAKAERIGSAKARVLLDGGALVQEQADAVLGGHREVVPALRAAAQREHNLLRVQRGGAAVTLLK